jgi:tripartite-type tricarboxylate transporter receptor subunit TctC
MILKSGVRIVKIPKIGLKIGILLAAAATFLAPMARAADEGNTPYRLIVGFPPGGALDTLARVLAEQLHSSLRNRCSLKTVLALPRGYRSTT